MPRRRRGSCIGRTSHGLPTFLFWKRRGRVRVADGFGVETAAQDLARVVAGPPSTEPCAVMASGLRLPRTRRASRRIPRARRRRPSANAASSRPRRIQRRRPRPIQRRRPRPIQRRRPRPIQRRSPRQIQRRSPRQIQRRRPRPIQRQSPRQIQRQSPRQIQRRTQRQIQRRTQRQIQRRTQRQIQSQSLPQSQRGMITPVWVKCSREHTMMRPGSSRVKS
jgi:hypothetical protein